MPRFHETIASGQRAEDHVYESISRYTNSIYRNVVVDSIYTSSGTTEIDIIAALANVIFIFEVKNVRKIEGTYSDNFWKMIGWETGVSYPTINTFNQNRIHVRSLRNLWKQRTPNVPPLVSIIVVPDGCEMPPSIRDKGIITLSELEKQLISFVSKYGINKRPEHSYALDFLVGKDNVRLRRNDFV